MDELKDQVNTETQVIQANSLQQIRVKNTLLKIKPQLQTLNPKLQTGSLPLASRDPRFCPLV
jgi:hypothetical protein